MTTELKALSGRRHSMRNKLVFSVVLLGALPAVATESPAGEAAADSIDQRAPSRASNAAPASGAAEAGLFLPALLAPRIYAGTAFASARAGYDGARDAFVARSTAEGSLADILALRVEFEHGPSLGPEDRVRVGGRLTLLRQSEHGVDGGVALFYDPKDFREEGNVVGALIVGRSFGRLGLFANALFGSDPEGDDQQLELRLASTYRAAEQLHVGLDTRMRYNMSSDEKRAGTLTTDWELQALPTLSLELGSIALVADVGVSALQSTGPFAQPGERTERDVGVLALAGAAGAF
jgi:hypothetical protein